MSFAKTQPIRSGMTMKCSTVELRTPSVGSVGVAIKGRNPGRRKKTFAQLHGLVSGMIKAIKHRCGNKNEKKNAFLLGPDTNSKRSGNTNTGRHSNQHQREFVDIIRG